MRMLRWICDNTEKDGIKNKSICEKANIFEWVQLHPLIFLKGGKKQGHINLRELKYLYSCAH